MSVSLSRIEEAALRTVVPGLEAEGYKVFLQPSPQMLPAFLEGYRPDAIAVRGDKRIAFEVVGQAWRDNVRYERVRHLQSLFAEHTDWEFRLIYTRDLIQNESIPVSSQEAIEAHLARIEAAYDAMGPATALLAAWTAFEAAALAIGLTTLQGPNFSSRLVEKLAGEGYITPDQADLVRQLSRARAQIAHGRLDLTPTKEQVDSLIRVTREMLCETA